MGSETLCKVKIGNQKFEAKVLLETNEIIIRGKERMVIPLNQMMSLNAKNGELRFLFKKKSISLSIGDKAEKWLLKISNPKSVIEKLGIKQDSKISIVNITDKKFLADVKAKTKDAVIGKPVSELDFIFLEANSKKELKKMSLLKKYLKPNGGMWIVFLKGKAATIKDVDVMVMGKENGLVDTKWLGFLKPIRH